MNEPMKVNARKRQNLIRVTPAGNEMNVRTIGGEGRETNAAQSPQRANHLSAFSRSSSLTMIQRP